MPCIGKGHGSGCWQRTEEITENKQRASSLVFITSVKRRGWRIRSGKVMRVQERQRVTFEGLFSLAAEGRMVHRGRGEEKLWKFLALCAQQVCLYLLLGLLQQSWHSSLILTKPLSWAYVTKWSVTADSYPQSRSKLKLSLSHWLAHFCLPAEASKHLPSSLHLKHNLACFYLWWQGEISPSRIMLGWWEVCPPPLPVTGSGEQPVTAACGAVYAVGGTLLWAEVGHSEVLLWLLGEQKASVNHRPLQSFWILMGASTRLNGGVRGGGGWGRRTFLET